MRTLALPGVTFLREMAVRAIIWQLINQLKRRSFTSSTGALLSNQKRQKNHFLVPEAQHPLVMWWDVNATKLVRSLFGCWQERFARGNQKRQVSTFRHIMRKKYHHLEYYIHTEIDFQSFLLLMMKFGTPNERVRIKILRN